MNKLSLIIRREYLAKVRNKSFIVMTVLSPLLLVGMVALIVFLTQMNRDGKRVIAVLNEGEHFNGLFLTDPEMSFIDMEGITAEEARDSTLAMGLYGFLHIPEGPSPESVAPQITFFTKEAPSIQVLGGLESRIEKNLREHTLREAGLSDRMVNRLSEPYEMRTSNFLGEQNLKGLNEFRAAIGGGFGYLIMMFIIIYGAFVMRSVIEEKTSRIIEVIISSVKPFQLMLGKIIGTSLAGITQFIIWILSASVLSLIVFSLFGIDNSAVLTAASGTSAMEGVAEMNNSLSTSQALYLREFLKIPWLLLLGCFLLYFILGYLIYSSIYAAIGAAVDNETDTQQFMFPVIMPLMLAIYVGFFSVFDNPHGPIAVGFSLFPLTSPIVMMMRLPGGIGPDGVPWWQLITSLLLLAGSFVAVVWFAARIYRVGILMYGKKPGYKELLKWIRYSS